ncbi:MAG TPA: sugar transferase [Flavisolibacter sp.]|nr:sugar transferase [Flavisolibacter sp.]
MPVEILKNLPKAEPNQYLRVATLGHKTAFCYLYIGDNSKSSERLQRNFKIGYSADSFEVAKKLIKSTPATPIDVIILDLPYQEKLMQDFQSYLFNRGLQTIPIIYNSRFFNTAGSNAELVDDVIDLDDEAFDFSNKICFLKKAKEYIVPKENFSNYASNSSDYIKRILDITLASILILLLLPLFFLIMLAIKLESKGPVIYMAKRAGRGFQIFNFYKFRTMVTNADKKVQELIHLNQYSPETKGAYFFKISNDPRITKVGRFLRNTSLDELPQLFNVLKGDMSLVGNRPLPLYEAATLTTNEFVERFMAPAGMTGLWQIKKRGKAEMSAEERIRLDILYVRNSSLLYDLWIMANTPKALIQKSDV